MTDKPVARARRLPNPKPENEEPVALTAAIVDLLREMIGNSVLKLIEEYGAATGLANLGEQFQAEVTQAVLDLCSAALGHTQARTSKCCTRADEARCG